MKKNKRTQYWYLRQVRRILEEISVLGKDQGVMFLKLKKKAKKYIEAAKALEHDGQKN